jgi:hypothetical protein
MYGYQIVKELERVTGGYLKLKSGTIYPSLIRLQKNGLASRSVEWQHFCAVISRLMQNANLATTASRKK